MLLQRMYKKQNKTKTGTSPWLSIAVKLAQKMRTTNQSDVVVKNKALE